MLEKTYSSLLELKNAMAKDSRYLALREAETLINKDSSVKEASAKMKEAEAKYEEDLSRFGENALETKNSQKKLYEAKLALDDLPASISYNEAFIKVKDINLLLDDLLFGDLRLKKEKKC